MKYLTLFEQHSEYESYKNSSNFIEPNINYCKFEDEIHLNKDSRLIVYYEAFTNGASTQLYTCTTQYGIAVNGALMFDSIEIDGIELSITELDNNNGQYDLSVGEHIGKFKLKNPSILGVQFNDQHTPINIGACFGYCNNIINVILPDSLTFIGYGSFSFCTNLRNIDIPKNVTIIGNSAFYGCEHVQNITLPFGLEIIENATFYGISITDLNIPDSVYSIGEGAFQNCVNLRNVKMSNGLIPNGVGYNIFQDCSALPVENNIMYAGILLVKATINTATSYTIKEGTKYISSDAFNNCKLFTNIVIPNSVKYIGQNAFENCFKMKNITLGTNLTYIDYAAFSYDDTIGIDYELTTITSLAETAPLLDNAFHLQFSGTLYVPINSSGYDVWMQNAEGYLGYNAWTKIEQ